ncbi:Pyruvate phosphate dikinase, PEP/pyruvate binding domain [uncultured archaeon]|nr:Pyruvate phosphate dikinase, PEP/pyruvate binding domain [uncultured archaeon]
MADSRLVWCGESPRDHPREHVGGKGHNLLKLYNLAQDTGLFYVPEFFVVPTGFKYTFRSDETGLSAIFPTNELEKTFAPMRKPVIVRSSSPLEDGLNASFAGVFLSLPDNHNYDALCRSIARVDHSAFADHAEKYTERMGLQPSDSMAMIVQEQVTDFLERGVIQLERDGAIIEGMTKKGNSFTHEIDYWTLREMIKEDAVWTFEKEDKERDYIGEGEMWYAVHGAKRAADLLGLEGTVQVEFLLAPARLPDFVQIRQLPKINSHCAHLDLDIPKGVPYLESQVCNGVPGDISLPAYVTFSESAFGRILIETGFKSGDERMQLLKNSKLLPSEEFHNAWNFREIMRFAGVGEGLHYFEEMWARGNSLFPEYILVCDKLDESICGMNNLTTGKRGIITCLEANKTSHAMTVARDLGIPAMGVNGNIADPNYFFHQVESGDVIRMKSDGKRAVAYVEKSRE